MEKTTTVFIADSAEDFTSGLSAARSVPTAFMFWGLPVTGSWPSA